MHDPVAVNVTDGLGQLGYQCGGLPRLQLHLPSILLEGTAGNVVHDHERATLVQVEVDDPDQVGVFQTRETPTLRLEGTAAVRIECRDSVVGQLEHILAR